jgi:D-glycero-D-manno-heptose 1,7-bisphosphate phosphatase
MQKAVFLDRDGVLNDELGRYVLALSDFRISQGVPQAIDLLHQAGYLSIVVTNQAGIARGLYKPELVEACHEQLQEACGGKITAFYYAPHHPDYDTESLLRKPDSLMLEKGAARFGIDLPASWMIGDKERDMQAGKKAGTRLAYIYHPDYHDSKAAAMADIEAPSLLEAVKLLLAM